MACALALSAISKISSAAKPARISLALCRGRDGTVFLWRLHNCLKRPFKILRIVARLNRARGLTYALGALRVGHLGFLRRHLGSIRLWLAEVKLGILCFRLADDKPVAANIAGKREQLIVECVELVGSIQNRGRQMDCVG